MNLSTNRQGASSILAMLIMVLFLMLLSAAAPMIVHEIRFFRINRDGIEAQYAAEAGAKVALMSLYKPSTVWNWVGQDVPFDASFPTTQKKYVVTLTRADGVTPAVTDGQLPKANMVFTITSEGIVNNMKKKLIVKAKTSLSNVLRYAVYSGSGNTTMNTAVINGDTATNQTLTTNNKTVIHGDATASTIAVPGGVISGMAYCNSSANYSCRPMPVLAPLDVSDLRIPMPAFPSPLPSGSNSHVGNYRQSTNINTPGQPVTIYVQGGSFTLGSGNSITGSHITIHAQGGVSLEQNALIQADSGGSISIYAESGSVTLNKGSQILGSTVTFIAARTDTTTTFSFNGGTINYNNPNSRTKIYSFGNVTVSSNALIGSTMSAFIMASANGAATGSIEANSADLNNTLLIAEGNMQVSGGTYAGLYSEQTLQLNKDTIVTYKPANATALDLPFAIRSWGY
jgi:hypothetical protein